MTRTSSAEPGPLAGLVFATYARKSNEDARNEDHRSTARQIENGRRYVEQRGGTVLPDPHIYKDEDISGAEFVKRPGLARFLNDLENGHEFNALVTMEGSRLGRELTETSFMLKKILGHGCRVFYYLADHEAKMDTATEKIMESLIGYAAEMEREQARQRARDTAERKARHGHATGGKVFGYDNLRMRGGRPAAPGERWDYVVRRVNEAEAEIAVGIFQMYADGYGLRSIVRAMNGDPAFAPQRTEFFGGKTVPSPFKTATGWNPVTVRNTLLRESYHGEHVWGKTQKFDKGGKAGLVVRRDPIIRDAAEHLRIIDEPLWEAVQKRLRMVGETFLRDGRGKFWGRPDIRNEGKYLLSGLAKCSECGGGLSITGGRPPGYACRVHKDRGTCGNDLRVPVRFADRAFLDVLERECLTPERFRVALQAGVERVRQQLRADPDRAKHLERERTSLAKKLDRWADAVGDGADIYKQKIREADARLKEIDGELARLTAAPSVSSLDLKAMEREIAAQLRRFADLLTGNVPRARQLLKKLLADRVTFRPVTLSNGSRTYSFRGELSYGALIQQVVSLEKVGQGSLAPDGGR
jgi:site-specific DNA recombinase